MQDVSPPAVLKTLDAMVRELEEIQDDERTLYFISRRCGAAARHLKEIAIELFPAPMGAHEYKLMQGQKARKEEASGSQGKSGVST